MAAEGGGGRTGRARADSAKGGRKANGGAGRDPATPADSARADPDAARPTGKTPAAARDPIPPAPRKRINLALQGGGAHGAFTWGVLERLLNDDGIEIAGISGTSAGALNGAALKAGMCRGGREGALEHLSWLWEQMGAVSDLRLTSWMAALWPAAGILARMTEAAMSLAPRDYLSQIVSPYSYGPAYRNPLERVVRRLDMEQARSGAEPRLFISATNVRTGKIRVFSGAEVTTDVILASACLPTIFQAVEIDDPATGKREAYWDGGYAGNPALFPLYDRSLPDDIVIVNINPILRDGLPYTPLDIENRVNEISFNASLLSELRAIAFVQRLIADGKVAEGTMKNVRLHMIADDALMNDLSATTKLMPSPFFLNGLREAGRAAADRFLADHRADLGRASTVDIPAMVN